MADPALGLEDVGDEVFEFVLAEVLAEVDQDAVFDGLKVWAAGSGSATSWSTSSERSVLPEVAVVAVVLATPVEPGSMPVFIMALNRASALFFDAVKMVSAPLRVFSRSSLMAVWERPVGCHFDADDVPRVGSGSSR